MKLKTDISTKSPKPRVPAKPRSKLQKMQAQYNFAYNFRLQDFHSSCVTEFPLSTRTLQAVYTYNNAITELRAAIRVDYLYTSNEIKYLRELRMCKGKLSLAKQSKK